MQFSSDAYYYIATKKFSSKELKEITISVIVLTLAFFFAFSKPRFNLLYLPIAFISITSGFLLHELAHKFVAQKYGCLAEYRMYTFGLLLALLFSLVGFVFAAPGAVYISGFVNAERNGKISLAGPLTNIAIAVIALFCTIILLPIHFYYSYIFLLSIARINIFLGIFNLLPILPLDGSKIFYWNKLLWISTFIFAIFIFVLSIYFVQIF